MTLWSGFPRRSRLFAATRAVRRRLLIAASVVALAFGTTAGLAAIASPATAASLPCDIYSAAGTPCVAAHSTVRALYAAYDGPLYQIERASNDETTDVYPLTTGGYADAATQQSFCADTSCTITEILDQSGHGNNLTIEGSGANGAADVGANAFALPVMAGGHLVYGVYVSPGVGYRDDDTTDVATGSDPEDEYMVTMANHVNSGCCFDYGNAETNNSDNGDGHMSAINFGTECWFSPCTGSGPWVQADLENGLFSGGNGSNTANDGNDSTFVTAQVKTNGTSTYEIKGGNANSGSLSTWYSGSLPTTGSYIPLSQEGAILLGTGGDDSNSSQGSFLEGVMLESEPSDTVDSEVQANIVSVDYALPALPETGVVVAGDDPSDCMDNNNASATDGNKAQMWACDGNTAAQNWTLESNGTIDIDGGCLDITGAKYTDGTLVEWWPCNSGANQQWEAEGGELVNPTSGMCLDDPDFVKTDGTQLDLWSCNGGDNQQWAVP